MMNLKKILTVSQAPDMEVGLVYKVTYRVNGFIQFKELITQERYENQYRLLEKEIARIKSNKPPKSQAEQLKAWERELAQAKKNLKNHFPYDIFTTESPMRKAYLTGFIQLPDIQGGKHYVTIEPTEKHGTTK